MPLPRVRSAAELLVRIDRHTAVPVRLQLEQELRGAVQSGRLPAGSRLPSTRMLASDLGLSRGVVVEAYEQLLAEGYFTARHGSSTRVAGRRASPSSVSTPEPATESPRFDLRPGLPDLSLFPRRAWMQSVRRSLIEAPTGTFDYPDPRGAESARAALAAYLNRARATVARPDGVMFTNGSAQGIGLVCRILREQGIRSVAVEDPGHADQCTDILDVGLKVLRIPVDASGLRVDRLERSEARAVLVTPAHQYPTGAVLAPDRRAELLEWAERTRSVIIEDDYDAEYRYDREPVGALQGLAPDRVVYVGSASKVLSPALRLGWLVVPSALVAGVTEAKRRADRGSSVFEQLPFADFLNRGELDRHLRRTRPIYRRRRDALVTALRKNFKHLRIQGVAAGLHFMIELSADWDEQAVVAAAARRSVRVYGASAYRANPGSGPPALLVGYGGIAESEMPAAVKHLSLAVAELTEKHSFASRSSFFSGPTGARRAWSSRRPRSRSPRFARHAPRRSTD